jgi:hypothetical protein
MSRVTDIEWAIAEATTAALEWARDELGGISEIEQAALIGRVSYALRNGPPEVVAQESPMPVGDAFIDAYFRPGLVSSARAELANREKGLSK